MITTEPEHRSAEYEPATERIRLPFRHRIPTPLSEFRFTGQISHMERITWSTLAGRPFFRLDLSGFQRPADAMPHLANARIPEQYQKPNHVLTLADVSNSPFDNSVKETLREVLAHNRPFVLAGALLGVGGLQRVMYTALMRITGRNSRIFSAEAEAIAWLESEARNADGPR